MINVVGVSRDLPDGPVEVRLACDQRGAQQLHAFLEAMEGEDGGDQVIISRLNPHPDLNRTWLIGVK